MSSKKEILDKWDEDHLFSLTEPNYDVRYCSRWKNVLTSDELHSYKFKKQSILTRFYQNLQKAFDFDDLDYLEISSIVENGTVNMFNPLRKKIGSDDYLSKLLKRKYVNSPFMRLFNTLGFRDMEILTGDGGYLHTIMARKSDELSFRVKEGEQE